ncbi:hypothetical protein SPACI_011900 [Sporomusa acidovorans DSM 3132]|uniref:Uncharacterized protein n=1 Tax=Sporomusa acidovorans (strain ATCC 49682 / DSM 3132 / Mol) TaxID=1123286 RepID=A0ABZ3IYW5_SPOA4|nr:hypothetical protein SPACI_39040 [Sporomusa acidovorans DSM 3132]SDF15849.1 hypothetical protein SAMN04488499_103537 [Sporomusa acidovorans]
MAEFRKLKHAGGLAKISDMPMIETARNNHLDAIN